MTTDVMIEAIDLTKIYRDQRAIDRLNFRIRRGEVVGFLGPNGAGKSTTMRILTCFIAPTSGTAKVGGNDVFENPLAARSVVGYLPQRAPLYTEMGVIEYLQFAANLRAIAPSEHVTRIRKVVEICGLGDALHKDIGELSHGYRQRVGLAQALLHDPPILILDEPTSDLDPNEKAEFIEYLKEIGRDRTVMLSTHNLAEVEASCPRVIIVSRGKIAADGSPEDLSKRSGQMRYSLVLERSTEKKLGSWENVRDLLQNKLKVDDVKTLPVESDSWGFEFLSSADSDLRKDVFQLAVAQGLVLLELHRDTVQLEEVFRELTVGSAPGARLRGQSADEDDDEEEDQDETDEEATDEEEENTSSNKDKKKK